MGTGLRDCPSTRCDFRAPARPPTSSRLETNKDPKSWRSGSGPSAKRARSDFAALRLPDLQLLGSLLVSNLDWIGGRAVDCLCEPRRVRTLPCEARKDGRLPVHEPSFFCTPARPPKSSRLETNKDLKSWRSGSGPSAKGPRSDFAALRLPDLQLLGSLLVSNLDWIGGRAVDCLCEPRRVRTLPCEARKDGRLPVHEPSFFCTPARPPKSSRLETNKDLKSWRSGSGPSAKGPRSDFAALRLPDLQLLGSLLVSSLDDLSGRAVGDALPTAWAVRPGGTPRASSTRRARVSAHGKCALLDRLRTNFRSLRYARIVPCARAPGPPERRPRGRGPATRH